jgi:hypothetical protein
MGSLRDCGKAHAALFPHPALDSDEIKVARDDDDGVGRHDGRLEDGREELCCELLEPDVGLGVWVESFEAGKDLERKIERSSGRGGHEESTAQFRTTGGLLSTYVGRNRWRGT